MLMLYLVKMFCKFTHQSWLSKKNEEEEEERKSFIVIHDLSCLVTKSTKWPVHPAKTQISLGIRPVWSESLLSAWRELGSLATHWAHSKDSDQTGRMPRLIWVFAGRTCQFGGFVMRWLIYFVPVRGKSFLWRPKSWSILKLKENDLMYYVCGCMCVWVCMGILQRWKSWQEFFFQLYFMAR